MKKRWGPFLIFLLGVTLWFAIRNRDEPAQDKITATGAGGVVIRKIALKPDSPNLQSELRVEVETNAPPTLTGPAVTFQYKWFVNKKEVGQGGSLSLGRFRQGDVVSVEVTPIGGHGDSAASASVKIGNNPPFIKTIRLLPTPVSAGQTVRAEVDVEDRDDDFVQLAYEWQVNGQIIEGNDETLEGDRVHSADNIAVYVTPSDPFSKGEPRLSPVITVLNRPPEITSVPPDRGENGQYTYPIVASDPDGDPLHFLLLKGPPGMEIEPNSGMIRWPIVSVPGNRSDITIEVNDGKGGKAIQQFMVQTTPAS